MYFWNIFSNEFGTYTPMNSEHILVKIKDWILIINWNNNQQNKIRNEDNKLNSILTRFLFRKFACKNELLSKVEKNYVFRAKNPENPNNLRYFPYRPYIRYILATLRIKSINLKNINHPALQTIQILEYFVQKSEIFLSFL